MPRKGKQGVMLESSIDVVLWAIQQRTPISVDAIRTRWGVHKSTAYRWLALLNDARDRAGLHTGQRYTGIRVPAGAPRVEVHHR